jgi:hypothetical protein
MRTVVLSEILDIARYEKVRVPYRQRIIELKKRRRIQVGPMVTFVFENHDTVLFQIQEMMRAERIVEDDAIQHEIETYNQLLPGTDQLAATMMIEIPEATQIREQIALFHGVNTGEATYLQIGASRLPGSFDSGQGDERRISAVQYVRFQLSSTQRESFLHGHDEVRLVIDHPNYHHSALITGDVRHQLEDDLKSD